MRPTGKVVTVFTYPFKSLGSAAMIRVKDGSLYMEQLAPAVYRDREPYTKWPPIIPLRFWNLPRFDGHGNLREKERGPDVREKEEQGVQ